jgi:archaemetzincin
MEEGFERLGPPRKGEWRSLFREKEQTFDAYVAGCANRRSAARSLLILQPLGTRAPAVDRMADYAAAFFGLTVRVRPVLPLVDRAHVPTRDQYNSSMILDELADLAPSDALVLLGIADRDLFARGKKFVFGEGSLERRVGVCSLARLASPAPALFDRRALKLMTHEIGHILSIAHCVTHRCVMQGSNTLEESDGHPLHLCPSDLRKLEWNTGVDRNARYRRLQAFYETAGWAADAAWAARRSQKRSVLGTPGEG